MADKFLLVAAVLEGRHFPKRVHRRLVVEARFNEESLATDPVFHDPSPDINTELAWEITSRELKHHRLQRTPIKLQFYAQDIASTSRDLVGYAMLDLRSAQKGHTNVKWYALLNSTYAKLKPEVRIKLTLESDSGPPVKQASAPVHPPKKIELTLKEAEGCFQLGPKTNSDRTFLLSLTITQAHNLLQLIPSDVRLDPKSQYQFSFNLLGNVISNKPFLDLIHPEFPIERAMLRIQAQAEPLLSFLSSQPDIEINLSQSDHVIAVAKIPVKSLAIQSDWHLDGCYQLVPTLVNDGRGSGDVGVVLCLELEEESVLEEEESVRALSSSDVTEQLVDITPPHMTPMKSIREPDVKPMELKATDHVALKDNQNILPSVESWHQFTFSIELRSVRNLDVSKVGTVAHIYLSYTYPFFGSPAPVMTHPAVDVQRQVEKRLPRSFCSFDFASIPQQLENHLEKVPLEVEVWHKDRNARDTLLGVSQIWLSNVNKGERHALTPDRRIAGWKQSHAGVYRVVGVQESAGSKIGELCVNLSLEDRGPVPPDMAESLKAQCSASDFPMENQREGQPVVVINEPQLVPAELDQGGLGGGPEFKAALELEVWKEEEERKFVSTLKEKEHQHMKALAAEWKKREKEREMLMQKRVEEYKRLEGKLKGALQDIEKRNRELTLSEQQLHQGWSALQQERAKDEKSGHDAEKRLKELYEHHLDIEKSKIKDLEEQKRRFLSQSAELERRYDAKVEEFASFRERQSARPEIQLQSDINVLTLEKAELERKVDALTRSKLHYKQQWGRALKELSVLKQQEQADARARLLRQQKELEHMRLRYLAHEEKEIMMSERREFADIKQEVERLRKEKEKETEREETLKKRGFVERQTERAEDIEIDDRVARLIEERDTLLQTGVYTHDDRIIGELDRQIRESLSLKGKGT